MVNPVELVGGGGGGGREEGREERREEGGGVGRGREEEGGGRGIGGEEEEKKEVEEEDEHNNSTQITATNTSWAHKINLSQKELAAVGKKIKRILDFGRVKYLRDHLNMRATIVRYCEGR